MKSKQTKKIKTNEVESSIRSNSISTHSLTASCRNVRTIYNSAPETNEFISSRDKGGLWDGDVKLTQRFAERSVHQDQYILWKCTFFKAWTQLTYEEKLIDKHVDSSGYKKVTLNLSHIKTLNTIWKREFIKLSSDVFYNYLIDTLDNIEARKIKGTKLKYSRHDWQKFTNLFCVNRSAVIRDTPVSAYIEAMIKRKEEPEFKTFWDDLCLAYDLSSYDKEGRLALIKYYATEEGYKQYTGESEFLKPKSSAKIDKIIEIRDFKGEGAF